MAEDDLGEEGIQKTLWPFIEAERKFVELESKGEPESAVRVLEDTLRREQRTVQSLRGTYLSSLFERMTVGYNTVGMKHLKEGNSDTALKYFEKAEALTDPANSHVNPEARRVLRAVTYNNLGCFFKSMNKLHTASQYLKKALAIEEQSGPKSQNPAGTHLNLCALLSQLGKHAEALVHAQTALQLLQTASPDNSSSHGESLVCVAYFNLAAEYEHLRKWTEAYWAYQRAHESCIADLGEEHALTAKIGRCLLQVKEKLHKRNKEYNEKKDRDRAADKGASASRAR
jgi:tetratricopeptide (TPR) repeat protein